MAAGLLPPLSESRPFESQKFCDGAEVPVTLSDDRDSPIRIVKNILQSDDETTGWIEFTNQSKQTILGVSLVVRYTSPSGKSPVWIYYGTSFHKAKSTMMKLRKPLSPSLSANLIGTSTFVATSCPGSGHVERMEIQFSDGTQYVKGTENEIRDIAPANLSLPKMKAGQLPSDGSIFLVRIDLDLGGTVTDVSVVKGSLEHPPEVLVKAMKAWKFDTFSYQDSEYVGTVYAVVRIDRTRCELRHCPFPVDAHNLPSPFLLIDLVVSRGDDGYDRTETYVGASPVSRSGVRYDMQDDSKN
ncbi:MAG TPA: energy transducer TonB [Candidatus Dormibacteraeota bacterium]|nr:energy transducer TonB [Candidatus Dormibacteraeota bacterium]